MRNIPGTIPDLARALAPKLSEVGNINKNLVRFFKPYEEPMQELTNNQNLLNPVNQLT